VSSGAKETQGELLSEARKESGKQKEQGPTREQPPSFTDLLTYSLPVPPNGAPNRTRAAFRLQRTLGNQAFGRFLRRCREHTAAADASDSKTAPVSAQSPDPAARDGIPETPARAPALQSKRRVPISTADENGPGLSRRVLSRDPARSLPQVAETRMEQAFGHDFSGVRIHTGATAERAAAMLGAYAFTIDRDIYFGAGEFAPGTPSGDRLLAHELTHVVQQDENRQAAEGDVSDPADIEEREAYASETVIAGRLQTLDDAAMPDQEAITSGATPIRSGPTAARAWVPRAEAETPAAQGEAKETVVVPSSEDELIPAVPKPPPPSIPAGPELADSAPLTELPAPPGRTGKPGKQPTPVPVEAPPQDRSVVVGGAEPGPAEPVTPDPRAALEPLGLPEGVAPPEIVAPPPAGRSREGRALADQAEILESRLESAGAELRQVMRDRANSLAEAALAAGEQATAAVHAAFAAEREALAAAQTEAIGEINQGRQAQLAVLEAHAAAERIRMDMTILAERTSATALIAGLEADVLATGEAEATRAADGSEERAAAILATADALQGEGDDPRAEAQRDAAHRIARDTAEQCREAGADMAEKVRSEAAKQARAYQPHLDEFLQKLDEATSGIGEQETAVLSDASAQINAQADQAILAVQQMAAEGSALLSAREVEAVTEIETFVQQRVLQLREARTAAAGQLAGPIGEARQALLLAGQDYAAEVDATQTGREALLADRQTLLQQGFDQASATLDAGRADVLQGLDELYADFEAMLLPRIEQRRAEASEASLKLRDTIARAANDAMGSLARASEEARTAITGGIDEVLSGISDAAGQFRNEVESNHAEAMAALAQAVDQGLATLDAKVASAEAEMGGAVQTIGSRYDSLKSEAERRSEEESSLLPRVRGSWWDSITGFFSDLIASIKQWLVDKLGEFWGGLVFGILAAVVMVIAGIVAFSIIGALIGSSILALKIVGIVLAVAAVVGVVYLGVSNRWEEYRQDHNGEEPGIWAKIGLGLLGIADLTGIPFLIEGIAGQRITGGKLEGFARGERIGMGLVFTIASLVTLGKFLFRPKGPAAPPEIKPPPEVKPPGVKPPEVKPPEEAPPETPAVPGKLPLLEGIRAAQQQLADLMRRINGLLAGDRAALDGRARAVEQELARLQAEADAAGSARQVERLQDRLAEAQRELAAIEADPLLTLGLRAVAIRAIETLENLKEDPLGEVNRRTGHNHYSAATREAAGEVVARRADGRPFDHIQDLQQAYNALENARRILEAETRNPPDSMTNRGLDVLVERYSEVQALISRLKGFLDRIGFGPPFPPFHQWPPGA
jgi:hypothetical protein